MLKSEAKIEKSKDFYDVTYIALDGSKKLAFQFKKTHDGHHVVNYGINDGFYKGTDTEKFLDKMGVKITEDIIKAIEKIKIPSEEKKAKRDSMTDKLKKLPETAEPLKMRV